MLEDCKDRGYLVQGFDQANLTIKQYNIQTPGLPINKLKRILKEEYFKLYFYDALDIITNPAKLLKLFAKAWKKFIVMN
jgi:hypothetical protein